jgi:lipoprotein-releasing system permease protein
MIRASLHFGLRQLSPRSAERSYKRIRGAIVGISLALVPMVVVIQVSGGLIRGITERYIEVGSFHLQARNFGGVSDENFALLAERLRSVEGVTAVYEIRYGLGLLQSEDGRSGVSVQALPPNIVREDQAFQEYLEVRSGVFELERENSVMLSEPIANNLGVGAGDQVKLLTARSTSTGRFILRQSPLEVSGGFTTGYHDLDEMTIIISGERGARLFREDDSRVLAIKVADPFGDMRGIRRSLQETLGRSWYVFTWYQMEEAMYNTFQTTQNLLLLIMAVIIVVAGVNISGGLIMLVMEKERDIAILRSCGVRSSVISVAFLGLGAATGVIGTVIGMGAGIFLAINVNAAITGLEAIISFLRYLMLLIVSPTGTAEVRAFEILGSSFYLDEIPVVLNLRDLVIVGGLSIAVSVVASIAPAWRASRLLPVDVLRRH